MYDLANSARLCLVCNLEDRGNLERCPTDGFPLILLGKQVKSADHVPGFTLEKEVGKGATGKIYKAIESSTQRVYAIKIMHDLLAKEQETAARFNQEAALTRRLNSPHTVGATNFSWLPDGRPYIVMEYVDGVSVSSLLAEEPLAAERAVPIFIQIATGLAHAHKQGIMHRDIKPSNIMLVDEGSAELVKIVDFGCAKTLSASERSALHLTRTGEAVGSPIYMSPEQCQGIPLDHRTDIYSLGCVMYEMLTGRPIFSAKDVVQLMTKHIKEEPAPLNLSNAFMADDLTRIVRKAVAKNPAQRYQDANEIMQELEQSMIIAKVMASLVF